MSLNVNETQSDNSEIEFDKNITNKIDNLMSCRNILQKISENTEWVDVVLIASVDGVR